MNWLTMLNLVLIGVAVLMAVPASARARAAQRMTLDLMPAPSELALGEGALSIDGGFCVSLAGHVEPRVRAAAERLVSRLIARTGVPMPVGIVADEDHATLRIDCHGLAGEVQSIGDDESYVLEVTTESASLTSATPLGVLRGLATFEQLVRTWRGGFEARAVRIADRPRFAWRGLLVDVCRHWHPIEVIKRNLDGMAAVKLNVLHLHLSEDQAFRLECKRFPRLHEMGSDGRFLTHEQVREIVAYARDRGIRVVPEFDLPGHSTSWLVGYPELAAGPGPFELARHWGIFDPCFDPTREEVYEFIDAFIGEMAELFPDEYFHVGGDEVNGRQWEQNPRIQMFMKRNGMSDKHDLQAHFNWRLLAILARHGKKMIGWDEVLHARLPADCVVQSWRGADSLARAVKEGRFAILSSGYYLDHMQPAAYHYQNDPLGVLGELDEQQKARVLGGEACMWAEYVTPETIDSRIWPRMAAIAERLWSPAHATDVADMYRRLAATSRQLEWLGLRHRGNFTPMLERLSGGRSTDAVRVLADLVEPVKLYQRSASRMYLVDTPLNRLVDAARPESDVAREVGMLAQDLLADSPESDARRRALKEWFRRWRDNHVALEPVLADSFLLNEAAPLSQDLATLGAIGLEALACIESGEAADPDWVQAQMKFLDVAEEPRADVTIAIVPAIRALVDAAGSVGK